MKFTVRQIADLIGGEVLGDDTKEVERFDKIEEGKSGGISFLANSKYEEHIYKTDSSAVIVSNKFIPKSNYNPALIQVSDPYLAFSELLNVYQNLTKQKKSGIEPNSFIHNTANIGKNCYIGAFAYVSEHVEIGENTQINPQVFVGINVKIGKNCLLHSGVKIYDNCIIGDDCVINSNVVIGSDGFGFAPQDNGTYKTIPQLGNVIIGNNVDIGACSTIDRATMGSTQIGNGVKIDNLVQIAHNVSIGDNTVIASQTGIAGSSKIGERCVIAGQVGVVGHISVANDTKIGAKAGINRTIAETGKSFSGSPIMPIQDYLKTKLLTRRLPDLNRRVEEIEKIIKSKENE